MDEATFKAAYNESRNGANYFVRHPLAIGGRFEFSDGVKELAEAGCYWLLDIIATECLVPLRKSGYPSGLVEVTVEDSKAELALTIVDDAPPIWKRTIDWTDMPAGKWVFELVDEGSRFAMALITEH
jgi:hypothetical protein